MLCLRVAHAAQPHSSSEQQQQWTPIAIRNINSDPGWVSYARVRSELTSVQRFPGFLQVGSCEYQPASLTTLPLIRRTAVLLYCCMTPLKASTAPRTYISSQALTWVDNDRAEGAIPHGLLAQYIRLSSGHHRCAPLVRSHLLRLQGLSSESHKPIHDLFHFPSTTKITTEQALPRVPPLPTNCCSNQQRLLYVCVRCKISSTLPYFGLPPHGN